MPLHQEKAPDGSRPSGATKQFTPPIIPSKNSTITVESIAESLGLIREERDFKGICPSCEYGTPSLSVRQDGGRLLIHCHACQDKNLFNMCIQRLRGNHAVIASPVIRHNTSNSPSYNRTEWAKRLYEEAVPVQGTLVEVYFATRGFKANGFYLPESFRFIPLARYDKKTSFPALIAPVTMHDGTFKGIQRIFIKPDGQGKADVSSPKKSLGELMGASVHLAPAETTLGLCEGIETGLAAMTLSGEPVWACLSTAGLINVVLPPLPLASRVIIFADNDPNGVGLKAAREAAYRFMAEGRHVTIQMPDDAGADYCDLLGKGV